jgi:hypothetical protein
MAGTVNYLYDAGQDVWVIDESEQGCAMSVRSGKISRGAIDILRGINNVYYDIVVSGLIGTKRYVEADVFSTLAAATAEYQTRLS